MRFSFEQLKTILRQAGWPESLLDVMAAIGLAESSGDAAAVNPGVGANGRRTREYSVGLWQVNTLAHPQYSKTALYDPLYNAKAALDIYKRQGLRAWGAFTDGRYKDYLPGGAGAVLGIDPGSIATGGIASGAIDWLRSMLTGRVEAPEDRFAPYLGQTYFSGVTRFQIASVVAIVVIAFAWREFS